MAEADRLIGLDAGTSMIKAVLFALDGAQLDVVAEPNVYHTGEHGAVTQDMALTWRTTASVLRQLVERHDDLPARLACLAVTGQGDGTWLIDATGEPVAPAWLWLDARAAELVERAEADGTRAELYRHTGCGLNACNQSAQLLWLKQHQPEVLARAATACHCKDWLYFRLTGRRVTDPSEGSFTFGDFRTRHYSDAVLRALDLTGQRDLLPEMVDGSVTTAPLRAEAARATGLRAGTPVSLGFVDVVCTAIGAGLFAPAQAVGCSVVGSTGMHMRYRADAAAVTLAEAPTGYTMALPIPGAVAQMQSNMAATLNIDWLADRVVEAAGLFGRAVTRGEAIRALDAEVLAAPPSAALYHPYISEAGERGPFTDATARASFSGLSSRTDLAGLTRAIYEGLAYAACDCYAAIGHTPDEVRLAGGAARSTALKTIHAAALNAPVRESTREEAGAAGAAMMAGCALGLFEDMAAAVALWVEPYLRARLAPDPCLAAHYAQGFELYRQLRAAHAPAWRSLQQLRAGRTA